MTLVEIRSGVHVKYTLLLSCLKEETRIYTSVKQIVEFYENTLSGPPLVTRHQKDRHTK